MMPLASPLLALLLPEHLDWVFSIYLGIPLPQKYRLDFVPIHNRRKITQHLVPQLTYFICIQCPII